MKKTKFILSVLFLIASQAQAGGIICHSCVPESDQCIPRSCIFSSDGTSTPRVQPFSSCPDGGSSACEDKSVGEACETGGSPGVCDLTPLTAGGFCVCNDLR